MQRIKNCNERNEKYYFRKRKQKQREKIAKRLIKRIIFLSSWLIFWSCTQSIPFSTKHRHTFSTDPGIGRNESKRSIARKSKRAAPRRDKISGNNFPWYFSTVAFNLPFLFRRLKIILAVWPRGTRTEKITLEFLCEGNGSKSGYFRSGIKS